MLEIKNLTLKYDNITIFENLNFEITEGKLVIVCGTSGTGKTSFINCISGIIPNMLNAKLTGKIIKNGSVTIVVQNPHISTFADNVIEEISFVFENNNINPDDIFDKIYPLTKECGIENILFESLNNISAGQKQKTALVSCISQDSKIIIMDEPFTLLDETGKKKLRDFNAQLERMVCERNTYNFRT